MKRIKTDYDDDWDHQTKEQVPSVCGERKYIYSVFTGGVISSLAGTWSTSFRLDPTTTVNLGGGAIGTPLNLCSPPVGSHVDQRIGRAIRIRKVTVRGSVVLQEDVDATGLEAQIVRVVLVLDKQTNGAAMDPSLCLQNGGAAVFAFPEPGGRGRFEILREKFIAISPATFAFSTNERVLGVAKYFKLKYKWPNGLTVLFNSTTGGTVTSVITNSLHILCGKSATSGDASYLLAYNSSVEYYDDVESAK